MPIRADRRHLYPANWSQIREDVLFAAGYHCQGTPQFPDCRAANHAPHPETGSCVVLTIAHMDHDETNSDRRNLRALCQRCHLTWDAQQHARNARATRRERLGVGELFELGEAQP